MHRAARGVGTCLRKRRRKQRKKRKKDLQEKEEEDGDSVIIGDRVRGVICGRSGGKGGWMVGVGGYNEGGRKSEERGEEV